MRLITNALRAASLLAWSWCQKPISRYEHRPTPSQPRKVTGKLSPSTRMIMLAMNRLR